MSQAPTIDRLLNLVPDSPDVVISELRSHPQLASKQDGHGYSLVHAATSYGHIDFLKALIRDFNVDPNITDEDGETALFNAENVEMAQVLLTLGVRLGTKNDDGQIAAEKLNDEDEAPTVAAFLRSAAASGSSEAAAEVIAQTGGANDTAVARAGTLEDGQVNGVNPPPRLPEGVQINLGTLSPGDEGEAPDPELRRRIEELAAREDFHDEAGQRELRTLVEDVVRGVASNGGQGSTQRRRVE